MALLLSVVVAALAGCGGEAALPEPGRREAARPAPVFGLAAAAEKVPPARADGPVPDRPRVPGTLRLRLRERRPTAPGSGRFEAVERTVDWKVAETAIVVCDMWDQMYCQSAVSRINRMIPRMNEVLGAARDHGVMIIHAPSGTVARYEGTPYRRRVQQARPATPPMPILGHCPADPAREPEIPLDIAECRCDDPVVPKKEARMTRQHPGLDIIGFDGVSDSGEEIYNFCVQEGIKNVALMGVHTNLCVLARPFGVRQLRKLGLNVALVRDLTDAMYDPRQRPHVSHARGTEIVVEHVETYLCPSVRSEDLTRVVPGSAGPLQRD